MALIKNIPTRHTVANYAYIHSLRWSSDTKRASACVGLCVDAAHRARVKQGKDTPLVPIVAKIRLNGSDFDTFFRDGVEVDNKLKARFYKAAKDGVGVVSDFGGELFTDAADD